MVRVKKRYVLLECVLDDNGRYSSEGLPFGEGDVVVALREAVKMIHGDYGLGSVIGSLFCKRLSKKTRICLFSCRFGPHYMLTTSIPFVKKIKETPCSLRQLTISGTIKGACEFLKKFYERQVEDYENELKKFENTKFRLQKLE
ncbi:ribonuclease P/MRP protein subunit POP5-like [Panonychus citri]|uniref:ribonuclease P/MRP protein subunit POP5-like n=1 Tax=Panonychus citri TaxID=50023 RepID=UPI002307C2A9|nr:ribonuclease P/MRP protein subunit POP5-like [Panonychus citri]